MAYHVVAPLVVAADRNGKLGYHYQGATIPWLSKADAERFVANSMVVNEADLADEEADDEEVHSGPSPSDDGPQRPPNAATKELWVEFAVSKGADRASAEQANKADLIKAFG